MAKYVCSICGYTHEGNVAPAKCPVCLSSASEFSEIIEKPVDERRDDSTNSVNPSMDGIANNDTDEKRELNDTNKKQVDGEDRVVFDDEEIVKIIETYGFSKAIEWYQNNYECSPEDAKEVILSIVRKNKDKLKGYYRPDEEEIFAHIEQLREKYKTTGEMGGLGESLEWYMERSDCNRQEAVKAIGDALEKYCKLHGLKNIYGVNNNGCMITILIAITTTLSFFCCF